MKKTEIKRAEDHELIAEYVNTYSRWTLNYSRSRGVKQLRAHLDDLEAEMLSRGFLTQDELNYLNM